MFSNKTLYIPDYVVYEDIPIIINYFDYYNIAKVKKVEVFKHHEPEYYVEDNYNYNYGYALIEIDYYYINQGAINFYNSIENKKGLIVYDDPKFWEVQFSPYKQDKTDVVVNNLQHSSLEDYVSDEEYYYSNEEEEEEEEEQEEEEEEEEEEEQEQEEEEQYNVKTSELKDDFNYASYEKNFASFKKKQNSKKQKLNDHLYEIKKSIDNINTKHDKLLKLLLINNDLKSKKKNNQKIKDYNNSWARRLRHQLN